MYWLQAKSATLLDVFKSKLNAQSGIRIISKNDTVK